MRQSVFTNLKAFITGGAGFIGSSLSEKLVKDGWDVTIFDNLTAGSKENLGHLVANPRVEGVKLIVGDCTRPNSLKNVLQDCDVVFHFAANPEVRMELNNPAQCFRQNIYGTHNVLEAFRESKAETIVFASTSTVYGEAKAIPTPEDYSPLYPISVYGGSKLASEALVSAYCHAFNKHGIILRLANVVGPRSNHGVVSEFMNKLAQNHQELSILGDGTQNKSYIYIEDCVSAIMATLRRVAVEVEIYNVGSEDSISVKDIGVTVAKAMRLTDLQFKFNDGLGDGRGWVGDVKSMLLDVKKLKSRGWTPKLNSRAAVEETVKRKIIRLGARGSLKSLTTTDFHPRPMVPHTGEV